MLNRMDDFQRPGDLRLVASSFGPGGNESGRGIIAFEAAERRLIEQQLAAIIDNPRVGGSEIDSKIDPLLLEESLNHGVRANSEREYEYCKHEELEEEDG